MKTMPNKTDRNDARALAQIMRTGWFRQVHVKSRQCQDVALAPGRTPHRF
jgi:transposase